MNYNMNEWDLVGAIDNDVRFVQLETKDIQQKYDAVRCYKHHLDGVKADRSLEQYLQVSSLKRWFFPGSDVLLQQLHLVKGIGSTIYRSRKCNSRPHVGAWFALRFVLRIVHRMSALSLKFLGA